MSFTRRLFLRRAGAAAAAAPIMPALATVPSIGGGERQGHALWDVATGSGWKARPPVAASKIPGPLRALRKLLRPEMDRLNEAREESLAYRYGVIEHDIAAMRSWSPSYQVIQQRKRDRKLARRQTELRLQYWPRTDDDEDDD